MELSPLAKERLASLGELSQEEREKLGHSQELSSLLSSYFTGKLPVESLWKVLKEYKDEGKEYLIKEAQVNLANAVSLGADEQSLKMCREGILTLETLKENSQYSMLEANLSLIENLCRQYKQEREQASDTMKSDVERQIKAAAQQIAQETRKEMAVDVKGSAELGVMRSDVNNGHETFHIANSPA